MNLDVVSLYVNFSGEKLLHMISIFIVGENIGKVSPRRKIVKRGYTMSLDIVYPKHNAIR
jgi:hypothetical protein